MNYTEKAVEQAVGEAYGKGHKDGFKSAKEMITRAFDIWEAAEKKAKLNIIQQTGKDNE